MSDSDVTADREQVDPYKGWENLTEDEVVKRLTDVVEAARGTHKEAARLATIAIGNAVWLTRDDWPKVIARANELLAQLEGDLSRRWA